MADGKVTIDTRLDDTGFKTGLNKMGTVAGTVATGVVSAIGAVTTAVVGVGVASTKVGATFEKSMSEVEATMGSKSKEIVTINGKTATSIEHLTEFAKEMGSTTEWSASQSADALNYMALAGYDAETSIGMLPNVLSLASAGSMDLATASDMVTDTQTAFGISLERTTQMVDEMAKASSTGNTSVQQLGEAFLNVGGLAQELNGGMITLSDGTKASVDGVQELEIALTAMANAGVKGSEAGGHMRNMLLKLSSPTSAGTKQLEELGVAVFDTEGNMRSLSDIFTDLNGSLSTLTQEQKIQAISDLFNTRDLASAEALLNAVGEDWDKIGESILDAEGSAKEMANTKLDNLSGDVTILKSALEGLGISIYDNLNSPLRDGVQGITEYVNKLQSALTDGGIEGMVSVIGEIVADMIAKLSDMIPKVVKIAVDVIKSFVDGIKNNKNSIVSGAVEIIKTLIDGLIELLPELIDVGLQIVIELANALSESLPEMIPAIVDMMVQIVEILIDNIDLLIEAGLRLTLAIGEGLVKAIPKLAEKVPQLIDKVHDLLTSPDNLKKFMLAGIQMITYLIEGIVSMIPMLIKYWTTVFKTGRDLLGSLAKSMFDVGVSFVKFILEAIIETWSSFLLPRIQELVLDLLNKFLSFVDKMKEFGSKVVERIKNAIQTKWNKLISNAPQWVKDLLNAFLGLVSGFAKVGSDIVSNIKEAISGAWNTVTGIVGGLMSTLLSVFSGLISPFVDIGTNIATTIGNAISGAWNTVTDITGGLMETLKNAFGGFVEGFKNIGSNIVSAILGGIQSAWSGLTGWISSQTASALSTATNTASSSAKKGSGTIKVEGEMSDNVIYGFKESNHYVAEQYSGVSGASNTVLNFYDTQTSPDAIYQKFYQQQTFGLARAY